MPRRPKLQPTDAELEVLQVLWKRGACTVREVYEEVNQARGTAYTTTLKIMQIMHEKGLVTRDDKERSHLYKAKARPEETRRSMVRSFIDRVFAGSAADMVLSALGSGKTSSKDLEKIRALIEAAGKEKKGK